MFGKNFDIEDRVSATEGESIMMGSFGAYGDEMEMGDEADFGNIGFHEYDNNMGEVDSFETRSVGDFGDDDMGEEDGMGFRINTRIKPIQKPAFNPQKAFNRATRINHVKMKLPKYSSAQIKIATPVVAAQQTMLKKAVRGWGRKNKNRIATIQQNAIMSGKKVPSVIDLIPAAQRSAMVQEATVKAMDYAGPKKNQPSVSPATSDGSVVVATAGSKLTQENVAQTPAVLNVPQSRSQYAHPMLAVMNPMGEGQMGFDFNAFLNDAKAKAQAALTQAKADVTAKLQQAGGSLLSQIGTRAVMDPKVQAMVVQETKAAAANTLAQKMLDPEVQKKAAKTAAMVAAAGVAGFFIWKAMKKK